jgi:hypothetical protein
MMNRGIRNVQIAVSQKNKYVELCTRLELDKRRSLFNPRSLARRLKDFVAVSPKQAGIDNVFALIDRELRDNIIVFRSKVKVDYRYILDPVRTGETTGSSAAALHNRSRPNVPDSFVAPNGANFSGRTFLESEGIIGGGISNELGLRERRPAILPHELLAISTIVETTSVAL